MSQSHPGIAISNPDALRGGDASNLAGESTMSASLAAELLCLAQRAEEPDAYEDSLTEIEAKNRILLLKRKLDG